MEQITREEMIELLKDGELLAEVTGNIDLAKRYGADITALQAAEPFMYGLADLDGKPYFSDYCVSADRNTLRAEAEIGDCRVVELFTLPYPSTISCQLYGHEVKGCGECSPPANAVDDSKLAELITKSILFEDCGNTSDWQDNINLGEAVVKALKKHGAKAQVPEGWKLVPVKPTPAMIRAFEGTVHPPFNQADEEGGA